MRKRLCITVLLSLFCLAGVADELAIGTDAPAFSLVDARSNQTVTFEPGSSPSVIVFTCNSCPYAKAFESRIVELGRQYQDRGVAFYAVNPNDDAKYPAETSAEMQKRAEDRDYPFPYLKDGDSSVARKWGARVTPHVFLVDGSGAVVYRGYVDDSAKPEERNDQGLKNALDAVLAGRPVANDSTKAFGCTIKWKS